MEILNVSTLLLQEGTNKWGQPTITSYDRDIIALQEQNLNRQFPCINNSELRHFNGAIGIITGIRAFDSRNLGTQMAPEANSLRWHDDPTSDFKRTEL